ncbi:heme-binding protein 1-like [Ptychodera flava]|uniref:heme-binding protein 1-like n=1 Tax=Ptychodera flava TaxID=63121 RepID=UPI00396A7D93
MDFIRVMAQRMFSGKPEELKYTVINTFEDYEERRYAETKFASIEIKGAASYKDASVEGWKKLFAYLASGNDKKVNINMTVPVCIDIFPEIEDLTEMKMDFVVSFLLPEKHHTNTPQPKDDAIKIRSTPERVVYVRTFGGFAYDKEIKSEIQKLKESLGDKTFAKDVYYFCAYDSPMKLTGRRNEVWLVKE